MGMTLIKGGLAITGPNQAAARLDVLVQDDKIAAVEANLDAEPGVDVLDASGFLIAPGLVNAHVHGRESLSKALVDNRPLELWLQEMAAFTEGRSAEDQYISVTLGAIEMLKNGVTSAYDLFTNIPVLTQESILAVLKAYYDVGIRALVAPSVSDIAYHASIPGLMSVLPGEVAGALDELFPAPKATDSLATVREVISDWVREHGPKERVRMAIAPVIPERCSRELLHACKSVQTDFGLPLHTHLLETRLQALQRLATSGTTSVAYLDDEGLLDSGTTLAHAIWLEQRDIERIAQRGCTVVHNPASNMKLGSGVMPLVAMRSHGVAVSIGTDGFQNMFEAMRLAAYIHRLGEPDYGRWPTCSDVLEMVWAGGSRAFGLEGSIGRLAPGFLADIALLDLNADSLTPLNDASAQLVMCETGSAVHSVMVGGRWVLRGGRCTEVDEQAIKAQARESASRLAVVSAERSSLIGKVAPYISEIRQSSIGPGIFNGLWPSPPGAVSTHPGSVMR
jgi:5-methylthioadenosine/S-adenosylhomocysteine deaminase